VNYYNFALLFEQSFLLFGSSRVGIAGTSISTAVDQSLEIFRLKGF
jgi:hypothetical protein